jgi:hypothetical protein
LKAAARQRLAAGQGEPSLGPGFGGRTAGGPLPITSSRAGHLWDALGRAYDVLGFDRAAGGDVVLAAIVAMANQSAGWCDQRGEGGLLVLLPRRDLVLGSLRPEEGGRPLPQPCAGRVHLKRRLVTDLLHARLTGQGRFFRILRNLSPSPVRGYRGLLGSGLLRSRCL